MLRSWEPMHPAVVKVVPPDPLVQPYVPAATCRMLISAQTDHTCRASHMTLLARCQIPSKSCMQMQLTVWNTLSKLAVWPDKANART